MNALTVLLTNDERGLIANELEKLYSFQDRPLAKDKLARMVQEITSHGYPYKAVIQGIRDMFDEDLKAIKLASILQSIREQIEPVSSSETYDCDECQGAGFAIMVDDKGYEKMFGCTCGNFQKWTHAGLVRWSGDNVQIVRATTYRRPDRFIRRVKP